MNIPKIENRPYTPSFIVDNKLKFRIPLYQRPYAWGRDQTLSLLKDLYAQSQFDKDQGNPYYYIGILNIARTVDDESRFDLIDGQQRITTLLLIGKVAIKYYESWKPFLDSDRLDLYGRVGDKAFLNGDKDFLENNEKLEFNKKMKDTLEEVEKFFNELKDQHSFSKFIYENAAFFLAEVPSTYSLIDKNRQFVRMNNRGKQLEKHEILKVKLLNPKSIPKKEERDPYLEIWNDMVECLSGSRADQSDSPQSLEIILKKEENKNEGQINDKEIFYTSICTIPEFLLIALARFHKEKEISPDKDKLLATFTSNEDTKLKDEKDIKSFIDIIKKQLIILKNFFLFRDKNDNYVFRIQNKNSKSIKNGDEDEDDEDKIFKFPKELRDETKNHLIAIQSYLYVSTEPHHWLIPAFNWCQDFLYKQIDANDFIEKLESIDNNLIREKRNLGDLPKEDDMTYEKKISHYWFYRLDYELWKKSQKKEDSEKIWEKFLKETSKDNGILNLLKDFRFRRCGSIEHIKPQKPQEGNSKPDHTFGNLALISSSRNSKFSNTHADGKKGLIVDSKYTESLKMLHLLYSDQNVEEQGKFMYKILEDAIEEALKAETAETTEITEAYIKNAQ